MSDVDAGSVIGEAGRIYGRHASVVVSASILIQTVGVMATFLVLNNGGLLMSTVLVGAIAMITTQLSIGAYTVLLLHVRAGTGLPTVSALIMQTLPRLLPLIGLAIVAGILIGVASVFLVLPGIFVAVRLAVAAPALVAGPLAISDALSSSNQLTKQAFGSAFVIVLFQGAIQFGIPYLSDRIAGPGGVENYFLANAAITALIMPLPALALAELFLRLSGYRSDPVTGLAVTGSTTPAPAHRVHVPTAPAPASPMPVPAAQTRNQAPAPQPWNQAPAAQAGHPSNEALYNPNYRPTGAPAVNHVECDPPPQPGGQPWQQPAPQQPAMQQPQQTPQPSVQQPWQQAQPPASHQPGPQQQQPWQQAQQAPQPWQQPPAPGPTAPPPTRTQSVGPPGMG